MTWQDELAQLIAHGWKPDIVSGEVIVRMSHDNMTAIVKPPQGIYGWWRGQLSSGGTPIVPHTRGRTASDVITEIHRLAGLGN